MRTIIVLSLCLATGAALRGADPKYAIVKEIRIGGEGGWDYIIGDASSHRIYASHATKIVVADSDTGAIVGEIVAPTGLFKSSEKLARVVLK